MRTFATWFLLLAAIPAAFAALPARGADPRPDWSRTLERVGAWLDPAQARPPVVVCRLGWGTNRTRIEFGREGANVWLWDAATGRVLMAPVAKAPDGLRPSVGLPFPAAALHWLPTACNVTNFADATVAGHPCAVTGITPAKAAREWLGVEDFRVVFWLRKSDGLPQAVRWLNPVEKRSLTAWPLGLRAENSAAASRWQAPAATPKDKARGGESTIRGRLPAAVSFLAQEFGAIAADAVHP